ncbi:MAG: hypothetical protein UY50_C0016G0003 [Parcubacteria group bacterium GW2011_GWA2_49_9]|nr:MAG: hypothetical protein UY50_C0016G0003 [Parcubacteria group bacterium GW2011_GWA2_49_9]
MDAKIYLQFPEPTNEKESTTSPDADSVERITEDVRDSLSLALEELHNFEFAKRAHNPAEMEREAWKCLNNFATVVGTIELILHHPADRDKVLKDMSVYFDCLEVVEGIKKHDFIGMFDERSKSYIRPTIHHPVEGFLETLAGCLIRADIYLASSKRADIPAKYES